MGADEVDTHGADRASIGLLIIRAWTEPGSSDPLRAHVRLTTDVGTGFQRAVTLCQADDVTSLVSAWLTEVRGPPSL
jgi:hypothetical protein